ncbi:MAG: hypothetical protein WA869_35605 [Alloacidobacterium sp.]
MLPFRDERNDPADGDKDGELRSGGHHEDVEGENVYDDRSQ